MDRYTTNLYKFWAILLIVGHNFFNSVEMSPHLGMNEFSFSANRLQSFFDIISGNYLNSIHAFFIFFGHYGVQVFVFVSAYGLTKKFSKADRPAYIHFQLSRLNKLYLPFVLAVLLYICSLIARMVLYGDAGFDGVFWGALLLKFTLLFNLIPNEVFALVGPWWFLAFIFQFYLIFPLVYKLISSKHIIILIVMVLMLFSNEILMTEYLQKNGLYIKTTIFGQYQVIFYGILVALTNFKLSSYSFFLSLFMVFLGNAYESFWYVSHFFSLIVFLSFVEIVRGFPINFKMPEKLVNYISSISVYLFLVNGFTRAPFNKWAYDYGSPYFTVTMAVLSLSFSVAMAALLFAVEKYLRSNYRKLAGS